MTNSYLGMNQFGENPYTGSKTYLQPKEYTRQLAPHTISTTPQLQASTVIGIKEGQSKFIEERYLGERITNITERPLEERVISSQKPLGQKSYIQEHVDTYEDEPVIKEVVVEKEVEVIVEKRVPYERYVDVPYDVYIERPIEKLIEKEIIIEKIMDKEIQKIVEVPIERVVEVPYEKIVERPIEIERRVEVPYERVVERRVEDL